MLLLRRLLLILLTPLEVIMAIFVILLLFIIASAHIPQPEVSDIAIPERVETSQTEFHIGPNWLKKNECGVWEMYIEGKPFERGKIYGFLARELIQKQEDIFVQQIKDFVPSPFLRAVLQTGLSFANKDLIDHIPRENLEEIYGVSLAFSDKYNYIAPKYTRILNYHAAHDIGHALNDYAIVGCTSFALNGSRTKDSTLLAGRNFDFYVGDDFAKEKLMLFVNPDQGYKFASYSWAGFTGVASGMNETGLSVTINASKSAVPTKSRTPIALLAREILQYASTIDEAITIARKRDVFVSESILISSARDNKAGLIEKGPGKTGVYFSASDVLICSNHFQSRTFASSSEHLENLKNSDTRNRFKRVEELLKIKKTLSLQDIAAILRDQKGIGNIQAGMGNPGTLNQLQGLHSVIFENQHKRMWISTADYQLGPYIAYDLNAIFQSKQPPVTHDSIASDPFRFSQEYKNYLRFRKIKNRIFRYTHFDDNLEMSSSEIKAYIELNPHYYGSWQSVGDYYRKRKKYSLAARYYHLAQSKYLPSLSIKKELKSLEQEQRARVTKQ